MFKKILKTKGEKDFKYEYRISFYERNGTQKKCETIKSIIKKSHCDIIDIIAVADIYHWGDEIKGRKKWVIIFEATPKNRGKFVKNTKNIPIFHEDFII